MTSDRPADDPFAPPEAPIGPAPTSWPETDFFALFLRWEKLRLVYNAALGVETVLGLAFLRWDEPALIVLALIAFAIAANVCFCAGLIFNGYAWWFGLRGRAITLLIFGVGMLLAMSLVPPALLVLSPPKMSN